MTTRLRQRITNAEKRIDDFEVTPDRVCDARGRWEDEGILPDHPKLREVVLRINQSLKEMSIATCGPANEDGLH